MDNQPAKAPRKRTPKAVEKPPAWVEPELETTEENLPTLSDLKLDAQQQVERPRTHAEILAGFIITGDPCS